MKLLDQKAMHSLRAALRRPYGGVTTFLPTEAQADVIRLSLLKNFEGMQERGDSIWIDTGRKVWAPVLIKKRDKSGWLFLTHHFLENNRRDVSRGECDVLLEYGGGLRHYVDGSGFPINPDHYEFNDLGELIGGRWVARHIKSKNKKSPPKVEG